MNFVKGMGIGASAAWLAIGASSAMAADQAQINAAITAGLSYLDSQQTSGVWSSAGYAEAHTGAAVFAMLSQKALWGANAATYQADVDNGINYLLNSASTLTVSTRNDGANICPGGGSSCTGVYWYGEGESTYTTGHVTMAIAEYAKGNPNAIATTSGPLANMTWKEVAQGVINAYSASQSSAVNGNRDGGWRYYFTPNVGDSDMSTTQWAVLASIYGQSLGATTPATVTEHLKNWLTVVQSPDGGACYQPGTAPCDQADTGGLLLSLNFVGKTKSDPAVQAALSYLDNNWQAGLGGWNGNLGHPYAMWAEYKALELNIGLADTASILNLLDPTCGGNSPTACNWWQDYNEWLVKNQSAGGNWPGYYYWDDVLATAYDLPILGGAVIPDNNPTVPEPATLGLLAIALVALRRVQHGRASA